MNRVFRAVIPVTLGTFLFVTGFIVASSVYAGIAIGVPDYLPCENYASQCSQFNCDDRKIKVPSTGQVIIKHYKCTYIEMINQIPDHPQTLYTKCGCTLAN